MWSDQTHKPIYPQIPAAYLTALPVSSATKSCHSSVAMCIHNYFALPFAKLAMSLCSRISVAFFSGCCISSVLETMALATLWMGMAMGVEHTLVRAPKNFLAIHSPGRLSCRSTSRTLWAGESKADSVFALKWMQVLYATKDNLEEDSLLSCTGF